MGHADIHTTMDIYSEVTEDKKRESMENISKNMQIYQERVHEIRSYQFATKKQICNESGFIMHYGTVPFTDENPGRKQDCGIMHDSDHIFVSKNHFFKFSRK